MALIQGMENANKTRVRFRWYVNGGFLEGAISGLAEAASPAELLPIQTRGLPHRLCISDSLAGALHFFENVGGEFCSDERLGMCVVVIRVKLSSEKAQTIALTPVVVQQMHPRELLDVLIRTTGKDRKRIREILELGTLISGASRYRWDRLRIEDSELEELLRGFPDPEPSRPFSAQQCFKAILQSKDAKLALDRDQTMRRRFLKARSFWDELIEIAHSESLSYLTYSYKEQADCFQLSLGAAPRQRLRDAAGLLKFQNQATRIRTAEFETVAYFVRRPGE